MRFNPRARIDKSQIQDREGASPASSGRAGFPIPTGRGGKVSGGTLLLILGLFVLSQCAGLDLGNLTGVTGSGTSATTGGSGSSGGTVSQGGTEECETGEDANASISCSIDLFTNSVQDYWQEAYPQEIGKRYQTVQTIRFSRVTNSACGTAQSQMGPFYCPNDSNVYLDKTFFKEMLEGRLGAKGGPFAIGYVIAHEYGHHIENQLGILAQMRTQQGPRSDGVKVELMADCLAGIWARNAESTTDQGGQAIITGLTEDDIRTAIDAAQAVGDDRIQQRTSGRVNAELWTHGSAKQRMDWFTHGMRIGTISGCNTFAGGVDLDNPAEGIPA